MDAYLPGVRGLSARAPLRKDYATKAKFEHALRMARLAGIEAIGSIELGPDGTIRIAAPAASPEPAIEIRTSDLPGLGAVVVATLLRAGRDHVERRAPIAGVSWPAGKG